MGFQAPGSFYTTQTPGMAGEAALEDGGQRSQPKILTTADPATTPNVFGFAYTQVAGAANGDKVIVGGAGGDAGLQFAGIMCFPKEHVTAGNALAVEGALAPSYQLPNQTTAAFVTDTAGIWANVTNNGAGTAAIGNYVAYDDTTGALESHQPSTTIPTGKTRINGATITRIPSTNSPLVVITMSGDLSTTAGA